MKKKWFESQMRSQRVFDLLIKWFEKSKKKSKRKRKAFDLSTKRFGLKFGLFDCFGSSCFECFAVQLLLGC